MPPFFLNSLPVTGKTIGIATYTPLFIILLLRDREIELLSGKNGKPAAAEEDVPATTADDDIPSECLVKMLRFRVQRQSFHPCKGIPGNTGDAFFTRGSHF